MKTVSDTEDATYGSARLADRLLASLQEDEFIAQSLGFFTRPIVTMDRAAQAAFDPCFFWISLLQS